MLFFLSRILVPKFLRRLWAMGATTMHWSTASATFWALQTPALTRYYMVTSMKISVKNINTSSKCFLGTEQELRGEETEEVYDTIGNYSKK